MITVVNVLETRYGEEPRLVATLRGLSTDTKPVYPPEYNGSVFFSMDTQSVSFYDGTSQTWK